MLIEIGFLVVKYDLYFQAKNLLTQMGIFQEYLITFFLRKLTSYIVLNQNIR